jgi:glycosyltransferase involved in cell wall biosynthesis
MANDSKTSLSIIVAVGDHNQFLPNFLKAVQNNFDLKHEFVFVVDTQENLQSVTNFFSDFCANYKVLVGTFGNPGAVRNAGLQVCTGEWITFHDVDDLPYIQNLKLLLHECQAGNFDIGCGVFDTLDYQTGENLETFKWTSSPILDVAYRPGIWRMIFNRKVINNIQFMESSMGEDQHFLMKIGFAGQKILFSSIHVYTYMQNVPNQLTSQKKKVLELKQVVEAEKKILYQNKSIAINCFNSTLIMRQMITLLKHGVLPSVDIKLLIALAKGMINCSLSKKVNQ